MHMRTPTRSDLPPPPVGAAAWPWTEESPQLPDAMPDGSLWPRVSIVTSQALAAALDAGLAQLNQGVDLRPACRAVAEAEYGVQKQARQYVELFQSLRRETLGRDRRSSR